MKLSSLQENLKNGLTIVSHVAGKNINLPILNNAMIEAKNGNIKLITTDLELGVVCTIRGKVEKEGAFTVDSKIITDYISLLPNKKADIEKKGSELIISCGNHKTKIKGQSAEEFPLIPSVEKKDGYKFNIGDFKEALSQVVFAVSNSESRLELSGVYFSFDEKKLTIAATDSYRLAEKTIDIKNNKNIKKQKIIIPAKTIQEIIRITANKNIEKDEIEVFVSENQILFVFDNTEIVSRLIEGQYPDYRQIIPSNTKTKITVNKKELVRAVKAAALFSKTGINDINLDFPQGKNIIVISSASGQTGENTSDVPAEVSGNDNGVVVNYRYILDGLNNIESDMLNIEVIDANTPCLIKPEKQKNYVYIIMPIKQ